MKEMNAPDALFFLKNSGFQPGHVLCAGCVLDGAAIDIGNPTDVSGDVNFRFVYGPDINFARGMRRFDHAHQRVAGETPSSIECVEVGSSNSVKLVEIVGRCRGKKRADRLCYLSLVGIRRT